ncbi:2724_t:CDS:1 [Cetraspora pellucida]|uniref:2724_t:CDS:1 n=1 Tax=Cetraspora pellucida TaxID=1433469 RepID=A0A9N9GP91_9GLOM|nr:2724_t:CDS:1 [Cetraspora pellucida]
MTNAKNKLNYFIHNILELEFEQIMKNYSISIEYDDDMFNDNIEEFDRDYVSDKDDLEKIIQFDCENLDANEIIDFDTFTEKLINEINYNNNIEAEKELDYNINEVINTAMNNTK